MAKKKPLKKELAARCQAKRADVDDSVEIKAKKLVFLTRSECFAEFRRLLAPYVMPHVELIPLLSLHPKKYSRYFWFDVTGRPLRYGSDSDIWNDEGDDELAADMKQKNLIAAAQALEAICEIEYPDEPANVFWSTLSFANAMNDLKHSWNKTLIKAKKALETQQTALSKASKARRERAETRRRQSNEWFAELQATKLTQRNKAKRVKERFKAELNDPIGESTIIEYWKAAQRPR